MNEFDIDKILEILPKLIKEDDRVKGAILSILSSIVATKDDFKDFIQQINERFEAMLEQMDERFNAMLEQMDKRFNAMQEQMDERFNAMQEQMDERFNAMQEQMDKRFDAMNERFNAMQEQMDKRFEAVDKRFEAVDKRFEAVDKRFDYVDKRFDKIDNKLNNLLMAIGKPFERFALNVVIRILDGENIKNVKLTSFKIEDKKGIVHGVPGQIIEIDGISFEPPIIVEVTTILRDVDKVEKFLKKKMLVEKEKGKVFRGFFVCASTEFEPEKVADISVLLKKNGCELINL
ncbi:MAG: hypothetical protein ACTSVI_00045 [Promethearchaeota archaeon]